MTQRRAVAIIDQVLRKQQLVREHPGLQIEHLTTPSWGWRARWTDTDGTGLELTDRELGKLLDALTARLANQGENAS